METELVSGRPYKLKNIFSGDKKIIIPDLQREYCWGNKIHGDQNIELVTGFLENLIDAYKESRNEENKNINLGMIYAYENPINHIQLCDGQQRITTMFLLMGVLNNLLENQPLKKYLISDFELKHDDKEPYLQYAIRESTLYFLSDLVCNHFLKRKSSLEIEKCKWYFDEYNLDPTIQSMIRAISIIENRLKKEDIKTSLENFSTFLINNVEIYYFDMVNRQHGEEMFVVINTTGEPLTLTENLKPLLLGSIENNLTRKLYSEIWESWESWFWQHREKEENQADEGLRDFLIWYWQIKLRQQDDWSNGKQEKLNPLKLFKNRPVRKKENNEADYSTITEEEWIKSISIDEVQLYFIQLKKIWDYFHIPKFKNVLGSVNKNASNPRQLFLEQVHQILLPLLEFMVKFDHSSEDENYRFLRRLRKNYFDSKWEDRNHNHVDWRHVLQIIEKSETIEEVFRFNGSEEDFKKSVKVNVSKWFNEEEQFKKQHIAVWEKIEEWEDHPNLMGDITFLLSTSQINEDQQKIIDKSFSDVDISLLESIYRSYQSIMDLLINEEHAQNNPKLGNLLRLFNLFIGCNKIGHIYRASSEFEGVLFSKTNREHIRKIEFMKMVNSADPLKYCEQFIKRRIKDEEIFTTYNEGNYSHIKFIKCWLVLKVFNANKHGVVLSFWDGEETGVAAYIDKNKNRLIDNLPFSIENSICGFGKRPAFGYESRISLTPFQHWLKPNIIDTPFAGINIDEKKRNSDELIENMNVIKALLEDIYN